MSRTASNTPDFSARLSFWLLSAFLVILWIAGGASRADVWGQGIVRFFAWTFLIVFALFAPRFEWRRVEPIAILLGLSILLVALQLVPLPPSIWTALPGRELFIQAAEVSGQPQPWRPLSISPSATVNALGSLVVPVAVLVFGAQLSRDQHWRIAAVLLALVFAGSLLALLQFSGARFGNPFINYQTGSVSGNFANRNHFALFVGLGCLMVPVWALRGERTARWKAAVAIGLLPFFLLVTLATGSRAGIILAGLGIASGLFLVRTEARRELATLPRWGSATIIAGALIGITGAIVLSIKFGRAVGITRTLDLEAAQDLRSQALPYVIEALSRYFPMGAGFGTFDPAYRIGEPDQLLQPLYFNHAHNDWLEVVLEGGIAGAALVIAALIWLILTTIKVFRRSGRGGLLARTAGIAALLIMLASVPDYPLRTPMIMAVLVMAGLWLHLGSRPAVDLSAADGGPS